MRSADERGQFISDYHVPGINRCRRSTTLIAGFDTFVGRTASPPLLPRLPWSAKSASPARAATHAIHPFPPQREGLSEKSKLLSNSEKLIIFSEIRCWIEFFYEVSQKFGGLVSLA